MERQDLHRPTKKVGPLKSFDKVIFMMKGLICFQGSFDDLQNIQEFQDFMKIVNTLKPGEKSLDQINEEVDKEEEEKLKDIVILKKLHFLN